MLEVSARNLSRSFLQKSFQKIQKSSCHSPPTPYSLRMSTTSTTTRCAAPPVPVLFAKDTKSSFPVLSFKDKGCQLVSLDKSKKLCLSLQKSNGEHVITTSLHTAKATQIYDLGSSGFSLRFEEKNNWKLTSTIFLNRQELENLRDKLVAFLA